jgi:hypothetical protein
MWREFLNSKILEIWLRSWSTSRLSENKVVSRSLTVFENVCSSLNAHVLCQMDVTATVMKARYTGRHKLVHRIAVAYYTIYFPELQYKTRTP